MVRDLQTNEKFYFLVDTWLQVYPDDDDVTCLQKTVEVASEQHFFHETSFPVLRRISISYVGLVRAKLMREICPVCQLVL